MTVPQHNTTEDTQNRSATEMPDEFIVKDKEDSTSVLSMSMCAINVLLILVQSQV